MGMQPPPGGGATTPQAAGRWRRRCCSRCVCLLAVALCLVPEAYVLGYMGYFWWTIPPVPKWDDSTPIVRRKAGGDIPLPPPPPEGCCEAVCRPSEDRIEHIEPWASCRCPRGADPNVGVCCGTNSSIDWHLEPRTACGVELRGHLGTCEVADFGITECPRKQTAAMFNPINVVKTVVLRAFLLAETFLTRRPLAIMTQHELHFDIPPLPTAHTNRTVLWEQINISMDVSHVSVWGMAAENGFLQALQGLKMSVAMPNGFDEANLALAGWNGQEVEVPLGAFARGQIGITSENNMAGRRRRGTPFKGQRRLIDFEATVHARAGAKGAAQIIGPRFSHSPENQHLAVDFDQLVISPQLSQAPKSTKIVRLDIPQCTILGLNICGVTRPLLEFQLNRAIKKQLSKIEVKVGDALVDGMRKGGGVPVLHWMGHAGCHLLRGCDGKLAKDVIASGAILYYAFLTYQVALFAGLIAWCCCCRSCWCLRCCDPPVSNPKAGDGDEEFEDNDDDGGGEEVVADPEASPTVRPATE